MNIFFGIFGVLVGLFCGYALGMFLGMSVGRQRLVKKIKAMLLLRDADFDARQIMDKQEASWLEDFLY